VIFDMLNRRKYIFYILYGIVVTIIFLYLLFPSEKVKEYLIYSLGMMDSDLSMAIDRISPVFPPGIKLDTVDLKRSGQSILDVKRITIKPTLLSLFSKNQAADFNGDVYGGTFAGIVRVSGNNTTDQFEVNADFSNIQIDQILLLENVLGRKISGRLEGKMIYKGKGFSGAANGNIKLTDSEIKLTTPILSLDSITFDTVEADLMFQKRILQVKNCKVTGKQITGNFSGTIRISNTFNDSSLNLTGTFKPQPALISVLTQNVSTAYFPKSLLSEKGVTIRLRGTVADPGYTIR